MGRSPCCDDTSGLKKGPWTPEEDEMLTSYIRNHGHVSWRSLPKAAGLNRCGKSCRLRWTNYLRPDIKRGHFSEEEENLIIKLHSTLGNKWSRIAARLSGRTDNEIKNHWNTHLRKKLLQMGIDPITHKPRIELNFLANLTHLFSNNSTPPKLLASNFMNPNGNIINNGVELQTNIAELAKLEVLSNILQILNSNNIDQPAAPFSYLSGLDTLLNPSNNNINIGSSINKNNIDFSQEKSKSWPSTNKSLISNFPSLVSSPENKNSNNGGSGDLISSNDHFFKDLENLLEDTNGESFWKEFINC